MADKEIPCPDIGCTRKFRYRMEKKQHLESNSCTETPSEHSRRNEIIKKDEGKDFICTICNTDKTPEQYFTA